MPFIPFAVCVPCKVPYRCKQNEILMEALAGFGSYYKVYCDKWKCPSCGHEILRGFANQPIAHHSEEDYGKFIADIAVRI